MSDETKEPKKRGPKPGNRRGGMPEGHKLPTTIRKEEAKAELQEMVLSRLRPIVEAGIESAMGIKHFMLRDPATGQFQRLTDPNEIDAALKHPDAKEGSSYWIFTKDPSNEARKDILDRALGKPKDEVEMEVKGSVTVVETLQRRKARFLKSAHIAG